MSEYGKLRDQMIQSNWATLSEQEFVSKVTEQGYPFYGCIFQGNDLMETGSQRACWKAQTMIGLDFDNCPVDEDEMAQYYGERLDLYPWLIYHTFSETKFIHGHPFLNFRFLWRVEVDLNVTYERWFRVIKALARVAINPYTLKPYADTNAADCSRLWQGSNCGAYRYKPSRKDPLYPHSQTNIRNIDWWEQKLRIDKSKMIQTDNIHIIKQSEDKE